MFTCRLFFVRECLFDKGRRIMVRWKGDEQNRMQYENRSKELDPTIF